MRGVKRRKSAAGTPDPTGGPVAQNIGRLLGGDPADRRELLEMVFTAEHGDREGIQQEKRNARVTISIDDGLACVTVNVPLAGILLRPWLVSV